MVVKETKRTWDSSVKARQTQALCWSRRWEGGMASCYISNVVIMLYARRQCPYPERLIELL
jgi:hypothetical protein